jgi:hypothetical protein
MLERPWWNAQSLNEVQCIISYMDNRYELMEAQKEEKTKKMFCA